MNEEIYKSQIFFINSSFINFYSLSWVTAFISRLCDFLSKMINFTSVKKAVHGTSTGIIQLLSWICGVTIELLPMTLALPGVEGNLCYKMGKAIALWYFSNSDEFISTFPPTSPKINSSSVITLGSLHTRDETLTALAVFTVSLPHWTDTINKKYTCLILTIFTSIVITSGKNNLIRRQLSP